MWVFSHTVSVNVMSARSQLHIKYSCPLHIIQAWVGVMLCLQSFFTLEPDEYECMAALLLWEAPVGHRVGLAAPKKILCEWQCISVHVPQSCTWIYLKYGAA